MAIDDGMMLAARISELVISDIGGELLVYDSVSHTIHQLNQASAVVWRACDGLSTASDIALRHGFTTEVVHVALSKLATAGLLTGDSTSHGPDPRSTRRGLMKKVAIAGSLPAVLSISAPMAAWAASNPPMIDLACGLSVEGCTNFVVCCTSYCTSEGKNIFGTGLISCTPNGEGWTARVTCSCTDIEAH